MVSKSIYCCNLRSSLTHATAYQATSPGTQQPPFGHSYQPPAMNGNAAPPHSQFFSAAYPSSPNQYAGPSAAPQQFNPYSYNPLPQSPSVQSIPEPARRAEYQAPVFKTFQERKREREAALRTASGGTPLNDSPVGSPMKAAGVLPTTSVRPTPPSSALAMMGIPGQPAPAPPPRIRPLPVAQPQLPAQNWGGVPTPPLRSTSPVPPSASPAPSSVSTSSSSRVVQQPPSISGPSQVPPRTASPVPPAETPLPNCATGIPSARPAAVSAIVERSDTVSSVKSVDRVGFGPSRRALPRPPSAVAPSKSLDRGNLPSTGGGRRLPRRGPSPISEEDTATLVSRLAGVSVGGIVPNSSPPTTASSPRSPITPSDSPPAIAIQGMSPLPSICVDEVTKLPGIPTISIGSETERKSPPVPVINIAAETKTPSVPIIAVNDTGSSLPSISVSPPQVSVSPPSRPASPGFAISGLPTIEVSSSDTRLEQGGPVPTAVPQIRTQPVTPSKASPGPTRIHTNSAILCAGCTNPIIGRIVSAMNQRWHPQCFMCGVCNELLEHVSAYEHEGKPYCHLDYHDVSSTAQFS